MWHILTRRADLVVTLVLCDGEMAIRGTDVAGWAHKMKNAKPMSRPDTRMCHLIVQQTRIRAHATGCKPLSLRSALRVSTASVRSEEA